jgi:hypothetical protein
MNQTLVPSATAMEVNAIGLSDVIMRLIMEWDGVE